MSALENSYPILILDQQGIIGRALALRLEQSYLSVLVSSQKVERPNIISVPFKQRIPKIPNNSFSHLFLVYQGEREIENALPSFVRKAVDTNAQLIFITTIFYYQDKIAQKLFTLYEKSIVIVLGDIFNESASILGTPVNSLLFQAKTEGRIGLRNDGLELLFPIFITDAIEGIVAASFARVQPGGVYAVLPPHPVTQLALSHALQRMYPLLKVDFILQKTGATAYKLPSSALPVLSSYNLDKRLADVDLTHTPLAPRAKLSRRPASSRPSPRKRVALFLLSMALFIISLPFLLTIGSAVVGGLLLQRAEGQVRSGDISAALSTTQAASSFLRLSDQTAITLRGGISLVGLSNEAVGFQSMIHTASKIADASTQLLESAVKIERLIGGISQSSRQDYQDGINQFKQGVNALQAAQVENNLPVEYRDKLIKISEPLSLLSGLIDTTPTLLGFNGEKTYLILFQNNFELRPGGGFIGSYGLLHLKNGKIEDLTIHDVYDADGKLKAEITPPFALNRFMGASHWFLRDSNFSPDFSQSASQAASFLKLETNQDVDGVIGIDVTFLSSLLEATGPLKLANYNKVLTKDNFYLETQSQVENNFFPGSTQKKDFLRAAEEELLGRLKDRRFSYLSLATVMMKAIDQKHLLFAFPDQATQRLFSINEMSGTIGEMRQSNSGLFLDTVGISEANIGQNKVNYYLKRSLKHDVMIDGEGTLNEQLRITYSNTSTKKSPFAGDYKAYLRIIVPIGAVLTGIQLSGVEQDIIPAITNENIYQAKTFVAPKGLEVESTTEKGRSIYGFMIQVPQSATKEVLVSYRLSLGVPLGLPVWEYSLLTLKQPGTLSDPYSLTVHYPLATKLLRSSRPVNDLGGKLSVDSVLENDLPLSLTFVAK